MTSSTPNQPAQPENAAGISEFESQTTTEAPASGAPSFRDFQLTPAVFQAIADVGYEAPSPIQAASIPPLLLGRDLVGQAQTGTGKTAAFALPLLSRLDPELQQPQILVLAPTRELAIQVVEAFQTYARHIKNFHILPVYGGQGMDTQLRGLKRGVQVVVGTPGRVIDHLKRKTLKLDQLKALVLDEADEMLKMGFIDDVEWILEQSPDERQVALFSATLPEPIRRIARKHLKDPVEIKIKSKTSTVDTITQRYWAVSGMQKLDALTRILEVEDFDGMLIFVRTKNATAELAEKLEARGFSVSALNGDMNQNLREKTIERLKKKTLDIVVATDVAARGLDVERISHVVNYDIPYDTEAYIHRIGRTGRAGRTGQAILFVAPRETRMLRTIERATKQPITQMQLPTRKDIAERRIAQFKQQLDQVLELPEDLTYYTEVIQNYLNEKQANSDELTPNNITLEQVAGALTYIVQQERPFQSTRPEKSEGRAIRPGPRERAELRSAQSDTRDQSTGRAPAPAYTKPAGDRADAAPRTRPAQSDAHETRRAPERKPRNTDGDHEDFPMARFRVEVGKMHGAEPKHLVGAIANEAGLDSQYIGEIKLYEDYSTVDLPAEIPKEIVKILKKTRVMGHKLELTPLGPGGPPSVPKRASRSPERPAHSDRAPRRDHAAASDRGARAERGPRTERTERGARPTDRGTRPDRPGRSDRSPRPGGRPGGRSGGPPKSFKPRKTKPPVALKKKIRLKKKGASKKAD